MTAQLLEGKAIAEKLQQEIASTIQGLKKLTKKQPKMVAIRVRENQEFESYLKSQKRVAEIVGIQHDTYPNLGENAIKLQNIIRELNEDNSVDGIMVQMPLPSGFPFEVILDQIDPKKDVEGITSYNLGQLVLKRDRLVPCTALSCIALIEEAMRRIGKTCHGKEAVVVGSSKVVGRPTALLLLDRMATTTVCHVETSKAGKLEEHVRRADILVVAVGKQNVIPGKWIKEGAIVIDAGFNHIDNKIVGDVEFEEAKKRAQFITPVPGGVGPLTTTMLMVNLSTAFRWQHINPPVI